MNSILGNLLNGIRRKVFVSYHHGGDQAFYDAFSTELGSRLELFHDNSLERRIGSDDSQYIMRRIREHHLQGSSCTIVLCGRDTPRRKYVDWEIEASLDQKMGLVGVMLPTIAWFDNGGTAKPPRLQDNIDSKYAQWIGWNTITQNPAELIAAIERANTAPKSAIANFRHRMTRNA